MWRAWTDAEQFAAWFALEHHDSPRGWTSPERRPPLVMAAAGGTQYPMEGESDELAPAHGISYAARPVVRTAPPLQL